MPRVYTQIFVAYLACIHKWWINITHMECGHTIMPICSISGIFTDILRQMQRNVHGAAGVLAGLHINSRVPNFHYKPTNSRTMRKNYPFPNAQPDKWYVFCVLKTAWINWKTAERKLGIREVSSIEHILVIICSPDDTQIFSSKHWVLQWNDPARVKDTSKRLSLGPSFFDMSGISKRSCSKNRLRIMISSFKFYMAASAIPRIRHSTLF